MSGVVDERAGGLVWVSFVEGGTQEEEDVPTGGDVGTRLLILSKRYGRDQGVFVN